MGILDQNSAHEDAWSPARSKANQSFDKCSKVRLGTSLLRLHRTGWTAAQLAQHFDRNIQAVHNDLTRFEQLGLIGPAHRYAPSQPPLVTTETEQFLDEKLLEERFWDTTLLCEAVAEHFYIQTGTRTQK